MNSTAVTRRAQSIRLRRLVESAMMLAIASQKCRLSISIGNPSCVSKSYPGFFDDFRSLGGTTE